MSSKYVVAVYDYVVDPSTGADPNLELSFQSGELIEVLRTDESGWWEGRVAKSGLQGLFPQNYTKPHYGPPPSPFQGATMSGRVSAPPMQMSYSTNKGNTLVNRGTIDRGIVSSTPAPQQWNTNTPNPSQQWNNIGLNTPQNETSSPPAVNKSFAPRNDKMGQSMATPGGGGERATKKEGGGEPAGPRNSTTLFGPWASLLAMYVGLMYAVTGVGVLIWGYWSLSPPFPDRKWTIRDALSGVYAILAGLAVFAWECFSTSARTRTGTSRFSRRALVYLFVPVPGFILPTLPTALGGVLFVLPALANLISGLKKEIHIPPAGGKRSDVDASELSCGRRFFETLGGQNPEGRVGRIVFILLFFCANIAVGTYAAYITSEDIKTKSAQGKEVFTNWVPVAKFFGWIMDLNYTIILIPVAHSFIRYLYNLSTQDQTLCSRFWRAILYIFPLDQSLEFHKLCGYTGGIAAILHTVAHVINFCSKASLVWQTFGISIWITGVGLLLIIFTLYPSTHREIKRGHFEIFWFTHMQFPVFIFLNIIHGKGTIGPNYWKFLILPAAIYTIERIYRFKKTREPVCLVAATFMTNEVLILAVAKAGPLAAYKEGQYAFIACPSVSKFQWHPFTISSAPQEEHVTFHIRVQGPGSWTRGVVEYLRMLSGKGGKAAFAEFQRMDQITGRVLPGKFVGPDGSALLRLYGPNSAPTQHIGEYNCVMVCASGIGVTPLSSAMKSIAFFKWKYAIGSAFPDQAEFFWITSHKELRSFRWFVRTVKEVDDQIHDLYIKNPDNMRNKYFHFHFYLTSYQEGKEVDKDFDSYADKYRNMSLTLEEDTEFWGQKLKESTNVQHESAPFDELQLYSALIRPGKTDITMGNVTVHVGRPKWQEIFATTAKRTGEKHIGVTFCGNPGIGEDLLKCCNNFTRQGPKTFHLHQEVF